MRHTTFFLLVLLLAACSSGPSETELQQTIDVAVDSAIAAVPTQTPLPTYTPNPTFPPPPTAQPPATVEVTRIIVVTATFSPTPSSTPTDTFTPSPSPNATQTTQAQLTAHLTAPKGNGFYLVGIDIAPGLWRSTGTQDNCFWERTNDTLDILDNHFGDAGGLIRIFPTDFQIEFADCGTLEYLGS